MIENLRECCFRGRVCIVTVTFTIPKRMVSSYLYGKAALPPFLFPQIDCPQVSWLEPPHPLQTSSLFVGNRGGGQVVTAEGAGFEVYSCWSPLQAHRNCLRAEDKESCAKNCLAELAESQLYLQSLTL
ncbi:UNVERIFIED_CONTAM: hypothetical protein K2H54_031548 [Gekko kuhli]